MTILILFTKRKKIFFRRKMQYDMELSFLPCIWKEFLKLWDVNYHSKITQNAARLNGSAYLNKKSHEDGLSLAIPCIVLVIQNLSCPELLVSKKILNFVPVFGSRRLSPQKFRDGHFGITYSRCRGIASTLWGLSCLEFRETMLKARAERLEKKWECAWKNCKS